MTLAEFADTHGFTPVELNDPIWIMHSDHRNRYCQTADGKLVGINLSKGEWTNEVLQQLAALDLSELVALNLRENKGLNYLVVNKEALPKLQRLDASECSLEAVKLPHRCPALQRLELQKNSLPAITLEGKFPALTYLDLSNNQLSELTLPQGFQQLHYLYLNDNQLTRLESTSILPELRTLHLRNNQLNQLPGNFLAYTRLEALYLYKNPLASIPKDVIPGGEYDNALDSVRRYLSSLEQYESLPLYEAKMILVGNGEVGKTSIRTKLLDKDAPLPQKEHRTQGLDIAPYPLEQVESNITQLDEPIDFQFNIWDFGGQGKYREVQQLFCSRKSLYLFVTAHDDDPEAQDYVGFEYWLDMVNAYSYDQEKNHLSPVIHVVNKIDQQTKFINQEQCQKTFANILDFVKVSSLTYENFPRLKEVIRKSLPRLSPDIFTDKYAEPWMQVKEALVARREEHFISLTEYRSLCEAHRIEEEDAELWLQILDRIGTVIYFGQHPRLKDWVILDPNWIKTIMYRVIDSEYVKQGRLMHQDLRHVWKGYPKEARAKFLELMKAYHLCYERKDDFGKREYVIPACLPVEEPEAFRQEFQVPTLKLKLAYTPFVPAGVVNKFMVRLGQQAHGLPSETPTQERLRDVVKLEELPAERELLTGQEGHPKALHATLRLHRSYLWRNNLVVEDVRNRLYAHVEENWRDKAVYLNLYGGEQAADVKPLFDAVNQLLATINENLRATKHLSGLKMQPMGWHQKKWYTLEELQAFGVDPFQEKDALRDKAESASSLQEHLMTTIAQDRLQEALKTLAAHLTHPSLKSRAVLLMRRLVKQENDRMGNTLSPEASTRERNQIAEAVVALVLAMDTEPVFDEGSTRQGEAQETTSLDSRAEPAPEGKKNILFLAANPSDQQSLQTDQELRLLRREFRQGRARDAFHFLPAQFAVTPSELLRARNDRPYVVHFSGHGGKAGILITNDQNESKLLPIKALKRLFKPLVGITHIVILNACYSVEQARALSTFGMYVVGTHLRISDKAAISFSKGFYNGLGEGKPFEEAFNDGMFMVDAEAPDTEGIIDAWKDGKQLDL